MQYHLKLSSSGLNNIACVRKTTLSMLHGYREKQTKAALVYGTAFHKYISTMFESSGNMSLAAMSASQIMDSAEFNRDEKTQPWLFDKDHLLSVCFSVWNSYIRKELSPVIIAGDKPLVEISFSHHFYETDSLLVTLEGTLDRIVKFNNGCYSIGDWKTTTRLLNDYYFEPYELSKQLRFYSLSLLLEGEKNPNSILGQIGLQKFGAFIDAVKTEKQPSATQVKRSRIFSYSKNDLLEFKSELYRFCVQFDKRIINNELMQRQGIINNVCEGRWGLCPFWNVCQAPEPAQQLLLKRDFKIQQWNPLNYEGK
jgi:hypothetical protein